MSWVDGERLIEMLIYALRSQSDQFWMLHSSSYVPFVSFPFEQSKQSFRSLLKSNPTSTRAGQLESQNKQQCHLKLISREVSLLLRKERHPLDPSIPTIHCCMSLTFDDNKTEHILRFFPQFVIVVGFDDFFFKFLFFFLILCLQVGI